MIQQLADAHAVQRSQERRIAELYADIDSRVRDVQRMKDQRIGELVKELEQCRKREDAIQKVFVQNHETVQQLCSKLRALETKEAALNEREARLEMQEQEFEIKQEEEAEQDQMQRNIDELENRLTSSKRE